MGCIKIKNEFTVMACARTGTDVVTFFCINRYKAEWHGDIDVRGACAFLSSKHDARLLQYFNKQSFRLV